MWWERDNTLTVQWEGRERSGGSSFCTRSLLFSGWENPRVTLIPLSPASKPLTNPVGPTCKVCPKSNHSLSCHPAVLLPRLDHCTLSSLPPVLLLTISCPCFHETLKGKVLLCPATWAALAQVTPLPTLLLPDLPVSPSGALPLSFRCQGHFPSLEHSTTTAST